MSTKLKLRRSWIYPELWGSGYSIYTAEYGNCRVSSGVVPTVKRSERTAMFRELTERLVVFGLGPRVNTNAYPWEGLK